MCGIVGAVAERDVLPILVEGLRRLEYRGYDSTGLAVWRDGRIDGVRSTARVADLQRRAEAAGREIAPDALLPVLADLVAEGPGLAPAPMAVKGTALPAFDPRGAYGLALSLAVGAAGPDAWGGLCLGHELLRKPVATDRFSFAGKARAVFLGENAAAVAASLGGCPLYGLAVGLEEWALALSAVRGEGVSAAPSAST